MANSTRQSSHLVRFSSGLRTCSWAGISARQPYRSLWCLCWVFPTSLPLQFSLTVRPFLRPPLIYPTEYPIQSDMLSSMLSALISLTLANTVFGHGQVRWFITSTTTYPAADAYASLPDPSSPIRKLNTYGFANPFTGADITCGVSSWCNPSAASLLARCAARWK